MRLPRVRIDWMCVLFAVGVLAVVAQFVSAIGLCIAVYQGWEI